jgi:hypothetical protein
MGDCAQRGRCSEVPCRAPAGAIPTNIASDRDANTGDTGSGIISIFGGDTSALDTDPFIIIGLPERSTRFAVKASIPYRGGRSGCA